MNTKIQKWGNSYGIRLPKDLLDSGVFSPGGVLELKIKDKSVVLKEIKKPSISLRQAMKGLTKSDFESVWSWGPDVGNEIIR